MWYNGHSYLYRISINIHLTFYASVVDLIFNGEIYIDSKELLSVVNTGNVAMLGNSYHETDNQFLQRYSWRKNLITTKREVILIQKYLIGCMNHDIFDFFVSVNAMNFNEKWF